MIVIKAINFGAKKHHGQKRKVSELPYVIHPLTVMYLISKFKGNSKYIDELQCVAILHDTLEDTDCSYIEIEREFGPLVASIVMELTSDNETIKKVGKHEYLKSKMVKMSKYAFILKLLDRLANVLDSPKQSYVEDTIKLMDFLLTEREDLSQRQISIINEIQNVCKSYQDKTEGNQSE